MPKEDKPRKGERGAQYNRKYDWDKWLQPGRKKTLIPGKHYKIGTGSMVQLIRSTASKRGLSVSIKETPDKVVIEVAA